MKSALTFLSVALGVALSGNALAGHGKTKLDLNGDKVISRQEAAARPMIAQNFDRIDTNRDGVLSKDELKAFRKAHRKEMKELRKTDRAALGK